MLKLRSQVAAHERMHVCCSLCVLWCLFPSNQSMCPIYLPRAFEHATLEKDQRGTLTGLTIELVDVSKDLRVGLYI